MISVGFRTDKGKTRSGNEDAVFVLPDRQMYMVADGVGGHNSGELASRMAVGFMAQFAELHPIDLVNGEDDLKDYFQRLISGANEQIITKAATEDDNRGMATTAVLCYIRENKAYVVNVGDSRAYLVRDGRIMQITKDHTLVQEMIDRGVMTPQEAKTHPDAHIITRALGGEPFVAPDFFTFDIYPSDTIIMCSDGLYGEVDESDMANMATNYKTMHRLAKNLVDLANNHGGNDNISVICIRIQQ